MGDAAHAMNPHVAQGRNSALEDASVLSKVIENCFRWGDFSYSALSDYEKIRRPEVEALQRTAHELTWLWESRFTPLIWARERIFRAIDKNPALHDKILHTVAGVKSEPYHLYDKWRALHLWAPV
jgi:2-polyprenyl-6-methoxyphenol hydroxylase-like FAD-dependent oxidoreductase